MAIVVRLSHIFSRQCSSAVEFERMGMVRDALLVVFPFAGSQVPLNPNDQNLS